jgi:hypothetical protein
MERLISFQIILQRKIIESRKSIKIFKYIVQRASHEYVESLFSWPALNKHFFHSTQPLRSHHSREVQNVQKAKHWLAQYCNGEQYKVVKGIVSRDGVSTMAIGD